MVKSLLHAKRGSGPLRYGSHGCPMQAVSRTGATDASRDDWTRRPTHARKV